MHEASFTEPQTIHVMTWFSFRFSIILFAWKLEARYIISFPCFLSKFCVPPSSSYKPRAGGFVLHLETLRAASSLVRPFTAEYKSRCSRTMRSGHSTSSCGQYPRCLKPLPACRVGSVPLSLKTTCIEQRTSASPACRCDPPPTAEGGRNDHSATALLQHARGVYKFICLFFF